MKPLHGPCAQSELLNSTRAGVAMKQLPVPRTLSAKVPANNSPPFFLLLELRRWAATGSMPGCEHCGKAACTLGTSCGGGAPITSGTSEDVNVIARERQWQYAPRSTVSHASL